MSGRAKKWIASKPFVTLLWAIGVVAVWELISLVLDKAVADPIAYKSLPYLHDILKTVFTNLRYLLGNALTTLSRALLGFAFGVALGFVLAILMSLTGIVEKAAFPYLVLSQMIPVLGLAPIFIAIFRDVDTTRVVIGLFITFFPVAANMLAGLKGVTKAHHDLMYSYAAKKHVVYLKLMIPSALSSLFTGMKIAAPLAITASIIVDTLSGSEGIGYLITHSLYSGQVLIFWSSVLISALMGALSFFLVSVIELLAQPYKYAGSGRAAGILRFFKRTAGGLVFAVARAAGRRGTPRKRDKNDQETGSCAAVPAAAEEDAPL
jgi:NitT/TauT family transport system permease protein